MNPRLPTILGARPAIGGFTMVEMMVTVTVLAILTVLAMPSLTTWVRNVRVRAVSDSLQNGLRLAQTEALRRSRQTVFSLTNSADPKTNMMATADGSNWAISVVKSALDASSVYIESGVLAEEGSSVRTSGPAAICFSSLGRLAANESTGVSGATCSLPTSAPPAQRYDITLAGADRPLRVLVSLGGQVRLCDPVKSLSSASPDGCP